MTYNKPIMSMVYVIIYCNYRIIKIKSISQYFPGGGGGVLDRAGNSGKYHAVNTAPVFPGQPWDQCCTQFIYKTAAYRIPSEILQSFCSDKFYIYVLN